MKVKTNVKAGVTVQIGNVGLGTAGVNTGISVGIGALKI